MEQMAKAHKKLKPLCNQGTLNKSDDHTRSFRHEEHGDDREISFTASDFSHSLRSVRNDNDFIPFWGIKVCSGFI